MNNEDKPWWHIEVLEDQCEVNKRRLVFVFKMWNKGIEELHRFEHDHWGETAVNRYTINDEEKRPRFHQLTSFNGYEYMDMSERRDFNVVEAYKHRVLAFLHPENRFGDCNIIIDRRYDHNHSFDVYFNGKAFKVGDDESRPIKNGKEAQTI